MAGLFRHEIKICKLRVENIFSKRFEFQFCVQHLSATSSTEQQLQLSDETFTLSLASLAAEGANSLLAARSQIEERLPNMSPNQLVRVLVAVVRCLSEWRQNLWLKDLLKETVENLREFERADIPAAVAVRIAYSFGIAARSPLRAEALPASYIGLLSNIAESLVHGAPFLRPEMLSRVAYGICWKNSLDAETFLKLQ